MNQGFLGILKRALISFCPNNPHQTARNHRCPSNTRCFYYVNVQSPITVMFKFNGYCYKFLYRCRSIYCSSASVSLKDLYYRPILPPFFPQKKKVCFLDKSLKKTIFMNLEFISIKLSTKYFS